MSLVSYILPSFFIDFITKYHVWLFYIGVMLLVYTNRKKFEMQGIAALYKTKFGLKLMDNIAKKHNKAVKSLAIVGVYAGYIGFLVITYMLIQILITLFSKPDLVQVSPVIPGVPIAGTGMVFPLVIGWVALLIIIFVHEFSHGVVARAYNLKILSSGFAFFGPIMGAFVEPDEAEISKQPAKVQNSIYASGPFSNILLTALVALILVFVMPTAYSFLPDSQGIIVDPIDGYPADIAGITKGEIIKTINGHEVVSTTDFFNYTKNITPGTLLNISTQNNNYVINATSNPNDDSKGYIGIIIKGNNWPNLKTSIIYSIISWISELLFWIAFISINIGLINLYPMFITDGARMLKVFIDSRVNNKKKAHNLWLIFNKMGALLLLTIIVVQVYNWIF